MRQLFLLGSSRLAQFPALDVRAEKALDIDLPVEKILGDFLALLVTLVGRTSQAIFYVIRRKDFGQFVVSLYEMIVSGFQHRHCLHLVRYVGLQLLQLGFFGCVSFCKKKKKYTFVLIELDLLIIDIRHVKIIVFKRKIFHLTFSSPAVFSTQSIVSSIAALISLIWECFSRNSSSLSSSSLSFFSSSLLKLFNSGNIKLCGTFV